jgi:hypothetical protein
MTLDGDARKLLAFMDSHRIDGSIQVSRGWGHIGATVVDAALQRRQNYEKTVKPRVKALVAAWPDSETTTGFRRRLNTGQLREIIRWNSPSRLVQIEEMTRVFESQQIDTVHELRDKLTDDVQRDELRRVLGDVRHVGPKTLDYFDILSGIPAGVAIDVRIRRVIRAAGIDDVSYRHISAVIRAAALSRGWRPGDIDAALWKWKPSDPS